MRPGVPSPPRRTVEERVARGAWMGQIVNPRGP